MDADAAEKREPSGSRRRDERCEEILSAAAELFAEKGVASTTVREIGKAVGMLSGSLYYYFDSKESMAAEILMGYLRPMLVSIQEVVSRVEDPRERLEALIRASCLSVEGRESSAEIFSHEYKYLLQPAYTEVRGVTEAIRQHYLDTITAGVRQGQFRDDVDPMLFYRFVRTSISLMVHWQGALEEEPHRVSGRSGRYSVEAFTHDCVSILLDGFSVRRAGPEARAARSGAARRAGRGGRGGMSQRAERPG
jgi:AcrR family transcriptional regulator